MRAPRRQARRGAIIDVTGLDGLVYDLGARPPPAPVWAGLDGNFRHPSMNENASTHVAELVRHAVSQTPCRQVDPEALIYVAIVMATEEELWQVAQKIQDAGIGLSGEKLGIHGNLLQAALAFTETHSFLSLSDRGLAIIATWPGGRARYHDLETLGGLRSIALTGSFERILRPVPRQTGMQVTMEEMAQSIISDGKPAIGRAADADPLPMTGLRALREAGFRPERRGGVSVLVMDLADGGTVIAACPDGNSVIIAKTYVGRRYNQDGEILSEITGNAETMIALSDREGLTSPGPLRP
jgi:hypothetical protein